jgi:hypothetical protein
VNNPGVSQLKIVEREDRERKFKVKIEFGDNCDVSRYKRVFVEGETSR